jgi:hypothetical protein
LIASIQKTMQTTGNNSRPASEVRRNLFQIRSMVVTRVLGPVMT